MEECLSDEEEEELGEGGRMRDLLASYYGADSFAAEPEEFPEIDNGASLVQQLPMTTHFSIDSQSFESTQYVRHLLKTASLGKLLRANEELVFEIKALDSDMQMLVYENYNKFIAATGECWPICNAPFKTPSVGLRRCYTAQRPCRHYPRNEE
jgi:hypothetical protein